MDIARLRHIQSIHESPQCRNPDALVRHFIPILERLRTAWLGREELSKLRADPFYYYLVARTKYYDQVVNEAVSDGVQQIINVGCGCDTRAYRFKHLLRSRRVKVLECDQPKAIHAKRQMARRWRCFDYVEYLPIDRTRTKALVLMEGVSPYINGSNFGRFLVLLATRLLPGSHVAYDFKIRGVHDDFGRVGRIQEPFRLSRASDEVATFHEALGLRLEHMELSSELCARLLPGLAESDITLFSEDGLVRLRVK